MRVTLGGIAFAAETLLLAARGKGHDRTWVGDDLIAVVDGSTPLRGGDIDAGAFAATIVAGLDANLAEPDPVTWVREALRSASPPERAGLPVSQVPSATACAIRAIDGRGEAIVLGDCAVVVESADGSIAVIEDRRIDEFDGPLARRFAAILRGGRSEEDAWRTIMPQLRENRDAANREGSYWLLANDERAAEEVEQGAFELDHVETILAYSDGFGRLVEPLGFVSTPGELLGRVVETGLEEAGRRLRELEGASDSLTRHPRLQRNDDASAVLLRRVRAAV